MWPLRAVPNGFNEEGSPTNFTIFAQPYHEEEIILLATALQDAVGLHAMVPPSLDDEPKSKEESETLKEAAADRAKQREEAAESKPKL